MIVARDWAFKVVAGASLILLAATLHATAQNDPRQMIATYRSFAVAQARLLMQLKANIDEKRKLEQQYKELDAANRKHDGEIVQLNTFCKGRFEPAEYRRRLKICADKQRALNARAAAISKVRGMLDAKDKARREQALKLKQDHDALTARAKALETGMAKDQALAAVMKTCGASKGIAGRSACIAKNWRPPPPGKAAYLLDALTAGEGDWKKSIASLEAQLQANPNNVAVRDALSYVQGLYEGHLALSSLGNVRYKNGVLAWMEGDYKDAALNFAESYELDPTDKGALSAFGFVSGLEQARTNGSLLAPCHLLPDCEPLAYSKELGTRLEMPAAYRLLSEDQLRRLYGLRLAARRDPQDLQLRATLNYVEGLSAWDSFRDKAKADAQKVYNLPEMVEALTRMGRGEYQAAVSAFARGLNEKWGEDGLVFSYFHAMGLNEGSRASPDYTPPIWDGRMKKAYDELFDADLNGLLTSFPGRQTAPPWAYAKKQLRREETAAWSRFLADPFKGPAR